jgi:phosphate transport system substrate-binding protein
MTHISAALRFVLFFAFLTAPVFAQDVRLTSRDGGVAIEGRLLDFTGEFFRVDTVYGELTLDGANLVCDGDGCPPAADLVKEYTVSGASAGVKILMPALVEAFAARNGYSVGRDITDEAHFSYQLTEGEAEAIVARFVFRVSNSGEGFADLLARETDMAVMFREITPAEEGLAEGAGLGALSEISLSRIIALDALVPVVSPRNRIDGIGLSQLAEVYAGRIRNWVELSGADGAITLHLREQTSGLSQAFKRRVMDTNGLSLSENIVRHQSNAALVDAVAADPNALGLTAYSATGGARTVPVVGACGLRSVASVRTIKTEDYPLTAPYFIYTPKQRVPRVIREFRKYVQSPAAQLVVRRAGLVDQATARITIDQQGERLLRAILAAGLETRLDELQRMGAVFRNAERLTLTFRFQDGSAELDAQSRSNIALLSEAIRRDAFAGKTLSFLGFSDGRGSAVENRTLSERRAEAVVTALRSTLGAGDLSRLSIKTLGFGEALPMACDEDNWGQSVNRRVEVWQN